MNIEKTISDIGTGVIIQTKRGTELGWHLNANPAWRGVLNKREIFDEVYRLCRKSFSVLDSEEFRKDVKKHILSVDGICFVFFGDVTEKMSPVCFTTDRVAAFVSYKLGKWKSKNFLYFSGVVVDPELHSLNYGSMLIQKIMKINKTNLSVLRTQSPVMYKSFSKVCKVYPSELGKNPSWVMDFGEYISVTLNMLSYNREKMIEKGTYGHPLYGKKPILTKNGNSLNNFFKNNINVNRGDSIILVGTTE